MLTLNATADHYRTPAHRWLSVIIGLISLALGVWCLFTPASTLLALVYLFIIGLFAEGIFEICLAFTTRGAWSMGWRLVAGIIGILLGVWLWVIPPAQATVVFIYVVGFWIFMSSAMGIAESIQMGGLKMKGWGWMLAFNILGLLFSFLFLLSPAFGGLFTAIYAGCAFISYGVFRIAMAWS